MSETDDPAAVQARRTLDDQVNAVCVAAEAGQLTDDQAREVYRAIFQRNTQRVRAQSVMDPETRTPLDALYPGADQGISSPYEHYYDHGGPIDASGGALKFQLDGQGKRIDPSGSE
ncbi:hypothetical protein AB1484_34495 [Parafrankia sp. FMc6]|uniref:hypothetical protein n=1 Tax=Parafrankia soli TaxID=2599596 RepID=UPI0034D5EFFD